MSLLAEGEFELNPVERMNPVWLRLKKHFEDRLAALRARNDNQDLDAAQTAALRGQISVYRGLLALGAEEPRN